MSGKVGFNVSLGYDFLTTVTVAPFKGKSEFTVREVEITTNKDGAPAIAVTLENTGNSHNYLCNATVVLKGGSWKKTLPPALVRALAGPGLVLPNHTRRIIIPVEDLPKKVKTVTATISF